MDDHDLLLPLKGLIAEPLWSRLRFHSIIAKRLGFESSIESGKSQWDDKKRADEPSKIGG